MTEKSEKITVNPNGGSENHTEEDDNVSDIGGGSGIL